MGHESEFRFQSPKFFQICLLPEVALSYLTSTIRALPFVRSFRVCLPVANISDILPLCFTRECFETQGRKISGAHVGNPSGGSTKVITRPRMGPAHPDPRNRPIAQSRMITFLRYLASCSLNRAQGPDDVTFTVSYSMVGVAG